ncbi:endoribonuclease L-PSP [Klebsiella aerogenes]|nr:endoribonuclease L-PSP [Klebsiella aerogenes]
MTITRIDAEARWSDVVIHNQTIYYTGVPENLDADAFEQTANTLAQIDAVLEKQAAISHVFLMPPFSSPIKMILRR